MKARKRSRRKRQRREAMRRALAHHGNVMRKLERLAKAMRKWDDGVSKALAYARESGVSLDELNASMREERRAAKRMGTMVYDLVPMDPVREETTWVGPTAARLPKILSVRYDDVMLFAETQDGRQA